MPDFSELVIITGTVFQATKFKRIQLQCRAFSGFSLRLSAGVLDVGPNSSLSLQTPTSM